MEQQGLRTGHLVALGGALVALSSLWRPWYAFDVPQSFRDAIAGSAAGAPAGLGAFAQSLASALPDRIQASGWTELEGADVALCVGALAVVALVLGAAGALGRVVRVDRIAAGRLIGGIGAAGIGLVGWHVASKPGGGIPGGQEMIKLASGIWIALAGCAITMAGGLLAAVPEKPLPYMPEVPAPELPTPAPALSSVGPPGP
jgi:hypothetical protein